MGSPAVPSSRAEGASLFPAAGLGPVED